MNPSFQLLPGAFGLCSAVWEGNRYRKATNVELVKCCLKACLPIVKSCRQTCSTIEGRKHDRCHETCEDIIAACRDNCRLSGSSKGIWGPDNPIYIGLKEHGCGDSYEEPINKECVMDNKDSIMRLCRRNCVPTRMVDCDEQCRFSYDLIVDPNESNPLRFPGDVLPIRVTDRLKSGMLYGIIYVAGAVVVSIGLIILIQKLNLR